MSYVNCSQNCSALQKIVEFHSGLLTATLPITTKVYLSSTKTHTGIKNYNKIGYYVQLTMTFLNQFDNIQSPFEIDLLQLTKE